MSNAEKAEAVFRALLKELGIKITEEQGEGVLAFKSEVCEFTLNVHRDEDGNFDKTVLEKSSCKKFDAVVDALSELLKAMSCKQPKDEEKSEETGEEQSGEKPDAEAKEEKNDGEAKEGDEQAEEKPAEPEA